MRRLRREMPAVCPTEHTPRVIGGGWKLGIVPLLLSGTTRYSEYSLKSLGR
jgi:DNA-binding HxlR family transcriptional regulator